MFKSGAPANTSTPFVPAPNEELVDCPYDEHKVLKHRMLGHLLKCRRNYELMCERTGQSLILIKCRYNPADEILGPEIALHESSCSDQQIISTHTIPYVRKPNDDEGEDDTDDEDGDRIPYDWTYVTRGILEYSGRPIAGEGEEQYVNVGVAAACATATTVHEEEDVEEEEEDDDDEGTQGEEEESIGAVGGLSMKMEPSPSKFSVSLRTRLKNRVILPIGSVKQEPPVKVENLKPPVFDESVPWSKEEDWDQQMFAMNIEDEDFDPNLNFNEPALLLHYPPALTKSMRKEYLEGKREQLNAAAKGKPQSNSNFEYLSFELDEDYLQRMSLIPPPPVECKVKKSIPPPPPSDSSSIASSNQRPPSSVDNHSVSSFQSTPSLSVNMKHARIRRPTIGISSLAKFSTPSSAIANMGYLDTSASDNESCAVSIKIEGDDEGSSGSEIEYEAGKQPEFFRYRTHLKTSILGEEELSTVAISNDSTSKTNKSNTFKKPK